MKPLCDFYIDNTLRVQKKVKTCKNGAVREDFFRRVGCEFELWMGQLCGKRSLKHSSRGAGMSKGMSGGIGSVGLGW